MRELGTGLVRAECRRADLKSPARVAMTSGLDFVDLRIAALQEGSVRCDRCRHRAMLDSIHAVRAPLEVLWVVRSPRETYGRPMVEERIGSSRGASSPRHGRSTLRC